MFRRLFGRNGARKSPRLVRPLPLRLEQLEDRAVPAGLDPTIASLQRNIDHIVVIYQENQSFDGLYGNFPGANGTQALQGQNLTQLDRLGNPITSLNNNTVAYNASNIDPQFPGTLPVQLYDATKYVPTTGKTADIVHRFYQEQSQIDGGKQDKYVGWSDNGYLTLSQFDASNLPEGKLAQTYTMDDNFFHSAYGGSYLNAQFLIAAAPQPYSNAPASIIATLDPKAPAGTNSGNGQLAIDPNTQKTTQNGKSTDGKVTPDGFAVNTIYSPNLVPNFITPGDATSIVPLTNDSNPNDPTRPFQQNIGDLLSGANVSWKWYADGWNQAVALQAAYKSGDANAIAAAKMPFAAGQPYNLFQWHHHPFAYYDNYDPLSANGKAHLQDEQNFFTDLSSGNLPAVSFIKQLGPNNEHPGYANLQQGQQSTADIVAKIQASPDYARTMIVITYDENGGRFDHVAPPSTDRWGDGTRVPAIIISPYARRAYVDHTQHDTSSILKTIEERFNLPSLNSRDAKASDLLSSLQLPEQKPVVVAPAAGNAPAQTFDPTGKPLSSNTPFPGFAGTVLVATGDVNGDGVPDTAYAASGSGNSHVKVFSGKDGSLLASFFAFPGYNGNLSLAVGDVENDGKADVIVGTDVGHVKAFGSGQGFAQTISFFPFAGYKGPVNVAAGDVNGDGKADLILTASANGAVKIISGKDLSELANFFAFQGYQGVVNAAVVSAGDGKADLVLGAGTDGRVRVLDGATLKDLQNFRPFIGYAGEIKVGATDPNGDGKPAIVVGTGKAASAVKVIRLSDLFTLGSFLASAVSSDGVVVA